MKSFAKQPAANGKPATFRDALLAKWPDAGKTKVVPSLRALIVPVSSLTPDPCNARVHPERNVEAVMESLAAFGQRKPIVVRAEGMVVMAGNGTLTAAKRLGWDGIAAAVSEMSDAEAAAYGIADNRTAELAEWDFETLQRLERLAADDGQAMPGWGLDELKVLRKMDFNRGSQLTDPDAAPAKPTVPVTISGDLWMLGNHRLLCGDSRNRNDLIQLMSGERATCVFTDPPYGVSIAKKNHFLNSNPNPAGGNTGRRGTSHIEGDEHDFDSLLNELLPAFINCRELVMADNCSAFVMSAQGCGLNMMMMMMMKQAGLEPRHGIVWKKNQATFSMDRLDYDYQHEPIIFTWKKTHKRTRGGEFKTSVWEVDKPRASPDHPTMKPVRLPVNAILNHTDNGEIVADIYAGSGTTIIAAQQTNRRAYCVEISPQYVDVCLQRWADFTGLDPIRERDGASFKELKKAREDKPQRAFVKSLVNGTVKSVPAPSSQQR